MANDKKLVESITSMEEDFAQWYTDVVRKAELIEYRLTTRSAMCIIISKAYSCTQAKILLFNKKGGFL